MIEQQIDQSQRIATPISSCSSPDTLWKGRSRALRRRARGRRHTLNRPEAERCHPASRSPQYDSRSADGADGRRRAPSFVAWC